MGGGDSSRDVPEATESTGGFEHSKQAAEIMEERHSVYAPILMRANRRIVCPNRYSHGLVVDGTGSMGAWSYMYHDKSDRDIGQVLDKEYHRDVGFNLCVIGDGHRETGAHDEAPIQVTEFTSDCPGMKDLLTQVWIEHGGGTYGQEGYEYAMYSYARKIDYPNANGRKQYLTILGDEGFYDTIPAEHLRKHFGEKVTADIPTSLIIEELKSKYHVLVLHIDTGDQIRNNQIKRQWKAHFGTGFIDITGDPKSIVDFRLGFMAIKSGKRDIDGYYKDMKGQLQSVSRMEFVIDRMKEAGWTAEPEGMEPDAIQL